MTEYWTCLCDVVADSLRLTLRNVPMSLRASVQEVRIRRGQPLLLSTATDNIVVGATVTAEDVQESFLRACGYAVHTHQSELCRGFVTAASGLRVGVAGTAVIKDAAVVSYRDITSLCMRVSREIAGVATPLLRFIENGGLQGTLICSAPSCGKTTLLTDLARLLSRRHRISVVDERGELSFSTLSGCDVLKGCPKSIGILQAVRTLSPDAVIADELGGREEWIAVKQSLFCGVPVMASAHITSREDVISRPDLTEILQYGGFSLVVMLPPRSHLEAETTVWKAREFLEDSGNPLGRVRLRRSGIDSGIGTQNLGTALESVGGVASAVAW